MRRVAAAFLLLFLSHSLFGFLLLSSCSCTCARPFGCCLTVGLGCSCGSADAVEKAEDSEDPRTALIR